MNIDEQKRARIDSFFAEYAKSPNAVLKRNCKVRVYPTRADSQIVKCAIGIFYNAHWESGLKQETYEENKDYIEQKISEAEATREKTSQMNSWIVCALAHKRIDHVLSRKALPFNVYRAINCHYLSAEDREEMDEFDSPGGYEYDVKALENEARKVATSEQIALAEKILAETNALKAKWAEEEKKIAAEKVETLEEANAFNKKYNLLADWSWDDYRYRLGDMAEEGKYWTVRKYEIRNDDDNLNRDDQRNVWKLVGYVAKQKNEDRVGIIGYMNYSEKNPIEQTLANPPPALKAMLDYEK
ncbi:MAG: hypothetical protein ACYC9R_13035 [Nitrosotalea sp.]